MWNGKLKAITFSMDDYVPQDLRFMGILDKYGLKCTFNVNAGAIGVDAERVAFVFSGDDNPITVNGKPCHKETVKKPHLRVKDFDKFTGHEIAGHTLTHKVLTNLDDSTIEVQVEEDRLALERLTGRKVVGLAYPGGGKGPIYDERVAKVLKEKTGVKYARTNGQSFNFELPTDLYQLEMTMHFANFEKLMELAKEFIETDFGRPVIFSIWGHTYEMDDAYTPWEEVEEFCKFISGKDDIFYGTNEEVYLDPELGLR